MKKNEKYSERFCNKENEVAKGIFNSENWGKRTTVMTLRDKFKEVLRQTKPHFIGFDSKECELIADDYAIEFAEFVINKFTFKDNYKISKELLEIFKNEKGL